MTRDNPFKIPPRNNFGVTFHGSKSMEEIKNDLKNTTSSYALSVPRDRISWECNQEDGRNPMPIHILEVFDLEY